MAPKKDYEDYTKFINDAYCNDKTRIMNNTIQSWTRNNSTARERPRDELADLAPLRAVQTKRNLRTKINRTYSTVTPLEKKLGS